jgi:hypothetical protein
MTWQAPDADPFLDLSDEAAQLAAVHDRFERRERQQLAAELATWVGTLRDLSERELTVAVRTAGGRVHRGALIAVGRDHVALRLLSGSLVLVALDAVRTVVPEPGASAPVATGDREHAQDRTLIEALERHVEEVREVVVLLRDTHEPLSGTVLAMGEDVLTLRADGNRRGTTYLPTTAIVAVLLAR